MQRHHRASCRRSGSVRLAGEEILGPAAATRITDRGIGYVPQGRRVWPSLTVDEHLRLARARRRGAVDASRASTRLFPRLAERQRNGGAQLSGGEQQMLAIGRALLFNPTLLVMDEPTEGLAPVIVEQVAEMLKRLAADGEISVLLIEQNLGVAIEVADTVDVMVNGRIARIDAGRRARPPTASCSSGCSGVRAGDEADEDDAPAAGRRRRRTQRVYTVRRAGDESDGAGEPARRHERGGARLHALERRRSAQRAARPPASTAARDPGAPVLSLGRGGRQPRREPPPPAARCRVPGGRRPAARAAYVAGTFDTKGRELLFLRNCLEKLGLRTVTVDLSTSGKPSPAMVHPREVARHHPAGERAVFTGDRGSAVSEMAVAFEHFIATRRDLGGLISARRLGRHRAGHRRPCARLPIGVPKVMVSTVASGDVKPYVGPSRHLHDVLGHRRVGHQPHLRARAGQRRARARRHDRATRAGRSVAEHQAGHRPHHVRRHHALRAGGHQARSRTATTASSSTPPAPAASRWRSWSTRACSPA